MDATIVTTTTLAALSGTDIERLNRYRLEHDLTFERLAIEMADAGYPIKIRTLHLTLSGKLRGQPRDRTRFKIREFIARLDERDKARRKRKAKSS
jgi:hypothetical protein